MRALTCQIWPEQKSLETTSQGGGWTALKAHFGVRGAHNWCSMGECFCPNRTMVGRWVSLVGLADIAFADIPTPCPQSGWVLSPIGGGCPDTITLLLTLAEAANNSIRMVSLHKSVNGQDFLDSELIV